MVQSNTKEKREMSLQNKVSIVGGKLILSLPEAETPVVWQMNLDNAQASAFTISEDKKKKIFTLLSKTQDGNENDIADFKQKDAAIAVLMQASEVLQNNVAVGVGVEVNQNAVAVGTKDKSDKYGALIAFFLIVVLFVVWMISASSNIEDISGVSGGTSPSGVASSPRESSGVPVSADDFLSNR